MVTRTHTEEMLQGQAPAERFASLCPSATDATVRPAGTYGNLDTIQKPSLTW